MESLTGIPSFDWVLAQFNAVAVALVVGAFLWRTPGSRVRGVLLVPFVVGAAGIVVLAALFASDTQSLLGSVGDRWAAAGVAVAVLLVAVAIADFLVARAAPLLLRAGILGHGRRAGDAALAITLLAPAALALAGVVRLDDRTTSGYELSQATSSEGATVMAEYELPGQPMDVVLRSESQGYISFGDGRIARFVLPEPRAAELQLTVEATGLDSPRGIAVVGDALIVADLGPLPCEQRFPCKGENVEAASVEEGERRILRESSGRLLRFEIRADGTLANRRVLVDRLPVANSDHGVNAVTAGEAGRVYVTIGNLDRIVATPLTVAERRRPNFSLLGAVLSLRPDGSDLRVVARGTRNVYDLAFDEDGRLFGIDNDGETRGGWRHEEVLEIRNGADYGYPFDGTFGPYTHRTVPALWTLETAGSAGIEWIRRDGRPTLVVGSCDDVYAVELDDSGAAVTVSEGDPVQHLLTVPGCVTAVEPLTSGRLVMTLFTFGGPPRLYVVELEP